MTSPSSTSSFPSDQSGTSLLLATDIAGTLHCYVYCSGSSPSLMHLWTRRLNEQNDDNDASSVGITVADADNTQENSTRKTQRREDATLDISCFHCILSKQLSRLKPPHWFSGKSMTPAGQPPNTANRQSSDRRLSTAYVSVDSNVIKDVRISSTAENPSSQVLLSALGERLSSDTQRGKSATSSKRAVVNASRQKKCCAVERTKSAGIIFSKPSPVLCPFCVPSSFSSPLPTIESVSTTATSTTPRLSPATTIASREQSGAQHASTSENVEPFQCCDFMARIPASFYPSTSNDTERLVTLSARKLPDTLTAVTSASEIAWYWRCPHGFFSETSESAQQDVKGEEKEAARETLPHTWMSLSAAVRRWNRSCCRHHRLLLLRKMEETYQELDLFTGKPLHKASLITDPFAAAPPGSMVSGASSENSDNDAIPASGSCTSSSLFDSVAEPLAVLSLTKKCSQTNVVQASSSVPKTGGQNKSKRRKKSETGLSPTGGATTTAAVAATSTCLVKLAAPTVQFDVTWYPPAASDAPTTTTVSNDYCDDAEDNTECSSTACPSTTTPCVPSTHHDAQTRSSSGDGDNHSHHDSTSASDIDMDILSGRKRLPPQYHFVQPVNRDSVDSAESSSIPFSSSSSSRKGNTMVLKKKAVGAARVVDHGDDASSEENQDSDVPVCCGRGGEVYLAKDIQYESCPVSADDGEEGEANSAPQPILQLPVPLVQAVWVCLPSYSRANNKTDKEGTISSSSTDMSSQKEVSDTRAPSTSLPIPVRSVPWVPVYACAVRTLENVASSSAFSKRRSHPTTKSTKTQSPVTDTQVSTLHGFLLQTTHRDGGDKTLTQVLPSLHDCPQVLRPLTMLDLLCSKTHTIHLHQRSHSLLSFESHYMKGEHTDEVPAQKRCHGSNDVNYARSLVERQRHRDPYPQAFVQRETPRGGDQSRSTVSSVLDDGSSTQRIAPPPPHFVPATSFFDENFEPLTILGRGVGGAVLLARHRITGVFYAVKVLVARDYESERDILQEVRVHAMLENKYVVRYHACWSEVITATRAQQLAFIGVCHPHEANLPRQQWSTATAAAADYNGRSVKGADHGGSIGLAPCSPHYSWQASPTKSEEDLTRRTPSHRTDLGRVAPGGWDRLILPSHSNMLLIGSESASESTSPVTTVTRSGRRGLRSAHLSTATVDKYIGDEDDRGEETDSSRSNNHHNKKRKGSRDKDRKAASPWANKQSSPLLKTACYRQRGSNGTSRLALAECGEDFGDPESGNDNNEDTEWEESGSRDQSRHGEDHTIVGSRVVFLQMEFCQITLAHYLSSRTAINRVENLVILLQIVAGLRYLHSRGVLHRDLKPTNVFMGYRCQYDKVVRSPNSSSSSSSYSSDNGNERGDEEWAMSPRAQLHQTGGLSHSTASVLSPGLLWKNDSFNHIPSSCTALTLHSQRRIPLPSHVAAVRCTGDGRCSNGNGGDTRGLSGFCGTADPVTTLQLFSNCPTFDNMQTPNGEQCALDFVPHEAHQNASVLLQARLAKRPPPPPPNERKHSQITARVTTATTTASDHATENGAAGYLMQYHEGRAFMHHLANWLCHHFVQVRLGDFGLAKFLYQQEIRVDGFVSMNAANTVGVGSPLYASPEQLKGNRCTPASDAFSVGVVMAEMYLQPTTIAERLTVLREVRDGVYKDASLLSRYPELKLVQRLTVAQPERRATLAATQAALKVALLKALQEEVYRHYV